MWNKRLKPVIARLFPTLHDNFDVACLPVGHDGTTFLPRLGGCDFVRVITLRSHTDEGRLIKTHMTPEQAYDLGRALMKAAQASGNASLADDGSGFAVCKADPRKGWRTLTVTGSRVDEL